MMGEYFSIEFLDERARIRFLIGRETVPQHFITVIVRIDY